MARKIAKRTPEAVPEHRTISRFESLSRAEKEKVWEYYDAKDPHSETRPMTPAERAQWDRVQASLKTKPRGRPRVGKGAQVVAVSVEKALLDRADAYARQHGLGRSEVFVLGIKAVVQDAASKGTA